MSHHDDGLLVLDKPKGITSRDAVDQALRWFPRRTRMGHTGTLDPLATGVLVVCLGSATRLVEYVQRMSKTYRSVFRLGAVSDSDDADGTITPVPGAADPGLPAILSALNTFVGAVAQVPPAYSAAKVTGRRAYDLARRGEEVALQARTVQIHATRVLRYQYPELEVEIHCGKGTYIRSLARDLGQILGCGGHVEVLRRTRVGPFSAEQAVPLTADAAEARARLLPPVCAVAELPQICLAQAEQVRLRQGQAVPLPAGVPVEGEIAILDETGQLLAIGTVAGPGRVLRPAKVLG